MKRTKMAIGFCVVAAVSGCVSQSAYDSLAKENKELSERVARIEGDLYNVEEKSADAIKVTPKFIPAPKVEQNVLDAKINSFLKEYVGAQFGDPIDKFPDLVIGRSRDGMKYRQIPALKKFQYFDRAVGVFEDGKLYEISFFAHIDMKYSVDSTNQRINQTLADLAVTLGLDSNVLAERSEYWATKQCLLKKYNGTPLRAGYRRRGITFHNPVLRRNAEAQKRARKNAEGEELPAVE